MKLNYSILLILLSLLGCASEQEKRLIEAAGRGDASSVIRLLKVGTDVNTVALDDWTPLTIAADEGQLAVVQILIEHGADVNKPVGNISPMFFAASSGHAEIVKYLKEHGGRLSLPEENRDSFIDKIKGYNNPMLSKLIFEEID